MPQTQYKNRSLIFLVTGFTLLIISLVWLRLVRQHKDDYQSHINVAIQRNTNLAVALEQYTIRTLRNADAVLQLIKREYEREGAGIDITKKIKEHSLNDNFYKGVSIIGKNGSVLAVSHSSKGDLGTDYSEISSFRYHNQNPNGGFFISKPLTTKSTGETFIIVSRSIVAQDGSFDGVVAMQIEPAMFTRFYADAELRKNDIISLIAPDGTTYSRRTGNRESFGENIRKSPLFIHVARNPVGSYFAKDAIRGIPTFFSFRKLKQFPIIATVGTSKEDALLNYTLSKRRDYTFASLITVLILLFSVMIVLSLSHRKRIMKKVKESEIKYRSIVDNTKDVIVLVRTDGTIRAANPAAAKTFIINEQTLLKKSFLDLVAFNENNVQLLKLEELFVPTFEKELSFVRADGTHFIGEMVSTFHTNAIGEKSIIIIIRDITERKRLAEKLIKEQKRFQRKLTRQVILAQEREREEIGRELHDNVNQVLTTVKLYLEMAASNKDISQTLVAKSTSLVLDSINEIRNLSHSLSAPTLGTNSIIDSFTALIDSVKGSSGFTIQFLHDACLKDLPKEQKLALYRIVQEQLNNIIKHADAATVWITLEQTDSHTTLIVKDDGKGFDAKALRNGIGLNNIISRAKVFDGNVDIKSQPGQGCILIVSLPFSLNASLDGLNTIGITDQFTDVY